MDSFITARRGSVEEVQIGIGHNSRFRFLERLLEGETL
jgi:hypothetical protein